MVDGSFRAVYIFRRFLVFIVQPSSAKSDNLAARVTYREHNARAEPVYKISS